MLRAVLLFALMPTAALAWPVDGFIDVPVGGEKLTKFGALDGARIDDPQVAEVEVMPETGELLVTAKKAGTALVQLEAQGRFAVWRVRVGTTTVEDAPYWTSVEKLCKGAQVKPAELVVTIDNGGCRVSLLRALMRDRYLAKDMELTFGVEAVQSQLVEFQHALDAAKLPVKLRYEGAGLILEGTVDAEARRRVYFELFKQSVGRLAVTDRLAVVEAPPGPPTPAAPPPIEILRGKKDKKP